LFYHDISYIFKGRTTSTWSSICIFRSFLHVHSFLILLWDLFFTFLPGRRWIYVTSCRWSKWQLLTFSEYRNKRNPFILKVFVFSIRYKSSKITHSKFTYRSQFFDTKHCLSKLTYSVRIISIKITYNQWLYLLLRENSLIM
jgi:hypothetical protein